MRYQTVYAELEGSVAAPTAGLHFTTALLDALSAKGVIVSGLDLQVGPGTFKPVDVDDPRQHAMHPERYEIPSRLAGLIEIVREQAAACGRWAPPWSARSRARPSRTARFARARAKHAS